MDPTSTSLVNTTGRLSNSTIHSTSTTIGLVVEALQKKWSRCNSHTHNNSTILINIPPGLALTCRVARTIRAAAARDAMAVVAVVVVAG